MELLGLAMFYSWVHLIVLIFSKMYKGLTTYEKVVTIFGISTMGLFVIGMLSEFA